MKTRQQYEDEAIGHGVAEDNCIGYSTQRQRFREGRDAAACSFNTPKWLCMNRTHYYDVVGNVYDNPEKLK